MSRCLDRKSLSLSFALFSSFFAIKFFDALDRSESGGVLLLMLVPYATLCIGFLLFRLLWGIFCKRLCADTCMGKVFPWSRLALDVVPYSVAIFSLMRYDLSYGKFLILPLVVLLWDFCLEECRDRKNGFFFLLFAVVSYFLCGFWLFRGMDFSGNVVYLVAHFLEYLFPTLFLLFFRIRSLGKRLPPMLFATLTVFFLKALFGRISELDLVFFAVLLPCLLLREIIIGAVFGNAFLRKFK